MIDITVGQDQDLGQVEIETGSDVSDVGSMFTLQRIFQPEQMQQLISTEEEDR